MMRPQQTLHGFICGLHQLILNGERDRGNTSFTHLSLGRQRRRDYLHHQLAKSRGMLLGPLSTSMDIHQSKVSGVASEFSKWVARRNHQVLLYLDQSFWISTDPPRGSVRLQGPIRVRTTSEASYLAQLPNDVILSWLRHSHFASSKETLDGGRESSKGNDIILLRAITPRLKPPSPPAGFQPKFPSISPQELNTCQHTSIEFFYKHHHAPNRTSLTQLFVVLPTLISVSLLWRHNPMGTERREEGGSNAVHQGTAGKAIVQQRIIGNVPPRNIPTLPRKGGTGRKLSRKIHQTFPTL
ncbi:hypothetical protein Tco_0490865 [Tanacetum coccineum]